MIEWDFEPRWERPKHDVIYAAVLLIMAMLVGGVYGVL